MARHALLGERHEAPVGREGGYTVGGPGGGSSQSRGAFKDGSFVTLGRDRDKGVEERLDSVRRVSGGAAWGCLDGHRKTPRRTNRALDAARGRCD